MKRLFEMIETLLRGGYDLQAEKIITVSCDIAAAADDAYDELHAVGDEFADMLIDGLYEIAEAFNDGTPLEAMEYTRRVRELYEKAKELM